MSLLGARVYTDLKYMALKLWGRRRRQACEAINWCSFCCTGLKSVMTELKTRKMNYVESNWQFVLHFLATQVYVEFDFPFILVLH